MQLLQKNYYKTQNQKAHLKESQNNFIFIRKINLRNIKIQEQAQTKQCQNSFNQQQYNPIKIRTLFIFIYQVTLNKTADRYKQALQDMFILKQYQYCMKKRLIYLNSSLFTEIFFYLTQLNKLNDFNEKLMYMNNIKVAKIDVKTLLKLFIQLQQSYKITLNIKSQELIQKSCIIQSQFQRYLDFINDLIQLLKLICKLIIEIQILDFQVFQCYNIYFVIQKSIEQIFFATKGSVTNPKNQINQGRILVKRSASILYNLNFPLRSIYFSFLVIRFMQSSISKTFKQDVIDNKSYAQKYIQRFSGQSTIQCFYNNLTFTSNQRNYRQRNCSYHQNFICFLSTCRC
ncbi:unnamed protein product [Paramecium sonneborni]|uniref:Uncharacterized protein n=1 Tax=Paramecium sonneborni TaxID=65129 RepID=A0A8S1RSL0_9CILI|nr:unnamed protein product [Paramecium sonneborni]